MQSKLYLDKVQTYLNKLCVQLPGKPLHRALDGNSLTFSSNVQVTEPMLSTLTIQNKFDELKTLSDWTHKFAAQLGISSEIIFPLDLVLTEAVTNIIKYAYDDDLNHTIAIKLAYSKSTINIEVMDDGRPFDPTQYPEVVLPRSLEEANEGGLGIHLIRNYTAEYYYQRQPNENISIMVLHVPTKADL